MVLLGRVIGGPSLVLMLLRMEYELWEKQCLVAPLSPFTTTVLGTTGHLDNKLFNFKLFCLLLDIFCPNRQLEKQLRLLPFILF